MPNGLPAGLIPLLSESLNQRLLWEPLSQQELRPARARSSIPQLTNAQKLSLTYVPVAQQNGAIRVSGGTVDGVYTVRETGASTAGKVNLTLLGQPDSGDGFYSTFWNGDRWQIANVADNLYYSLSDTSTPDLATDWRNASDDSPASIFVELATGSTRTDCFYYDDTANVILFVDTGTTSNSRPVYHSGGDTISYDDYGDGFQWNLNGGSSTAVVGTEAYPWLADWTGSGTLTHPVIRPTSVIDYGQSVAVTDGLVTTGAGDPTANGYWTPFGELNGKLQYQTLEGIQMSWTGSQWMLQGGNGAYVHSGENPWDSAFVPDDGTAPAPTLTHPAVQTLRPPGRGAMLVTGSSQDGVYTIRGIAAGKPYLNLVGNVSADDGTFGIIWVTDILNGYGIGSHVAGFVIADGGPVALYYSTQDVATPDLVTEWRNAADDTVAAITVGMTDPQAGVFVSGGTQDGIYTFRGTVGDKQYGNLLGAATDSGINSVWWSTDDARWFLNDPSSENLYYSLSDVPTPDLASNWKNASDDTPASITVTSVSQGELDAGTQNNNSPVVQENGAMIADNAVVAGCKHYRNVTDANYDLASDSTAAWVLNYSGLAASNRPAFPWLADWSLLDPAPTVSRNNVAAEVNWVDGLHPELVPSVDDLLSFHDENGLAFVDENANELITV